MGFGQIPASTILPRERPLSINACALLRLVALICPKSLSAAGVVDEPEFALWRKHIDDRGIMVIDCGQTAPR
jgi:hypothetical protein